MKKSGKGKEDKKPQAAMMDVLSVLVPVNFINNCIRYPALLVKCQY